MEEKQLENNTIVFKYDNCEYVLNVKITINILKYYLNNKENYSSKEISKACIIKNNQDFISIIDLLNKKQLIFILNGFARHSGVRNKKIKSYDDFINFLEDYLTYSNEKVKEVLKNFSLTNKKMFQEVSTTISKSLQINIPKFEEFTSSFSGIRSNIERIAQQIAESIENAIKNVNIRGLDEAFEGCKLLLINLGYPYINIDIDEMDYIYEHRDDENIMQIIDNIIISNYTDEIVDKMLVKWKTVDFISHRIHIIEEAVFAYHHEKYYLAIPVFFSQIEGIIAEFFNHKKAMGLKQYEKYISKIISSNPESFQYSNEITKAYFFNNLLEHFTHGEDIPKFSRHAIIHGGDVYYGTKINSINIMIIFDTLLECMCNIRVCSSMD